VWYWIGQPLSLHIENPLQIAFNFLPGRAAQTRVCHTCGYREAMNGGYHVRRVRVSGFREDGAWQSSNHSPDLYRHTLGGGLDSADFHLMSVIKKHPKVSRHNTYQEVPTINQENYRSTSSGQNLTTFPRPPLRSPCRPSASRLGCRDAERTLTGALNGIPVVWHMRQAASRMMRSSSPSPRSGGAPCPCFQGPSSLKPARKPAGREGGGSLP